MTCRSDFFQIRPTADNDSMILKSLTFKLALAVVLLVLLPSVLLSAYL